MNFSNMPAFLRRMLSMAAASAAMASVYESWLSKRLGHPQLVGPQ